MDYISVSSASKKWKISERRIRTLLKEGRVEGAFQTGRSWNIPKDATKPGDNRVCKKIKRQILFSNVDDYKKKLDNCRKLTLGEVERFLNDFSVSFIYNSSAIEGGDLSISETALALQGVATGERPLKNHIEVVAQKNALDYILDNVKTKTEISERLIKNIHSLVLMDKPDDKGVYRKVPVKIFGSNYTPPTPLIVEKLMGELIEKRANWLETKHIIETITLTHLELSKIHPFIDGNGRTFRLLLNLELMQNGYPPIIIRFADIKKYFDAFDEYSTNSNPKPMINLIKNYVLETMLEHIKILSV